MIYKWKHKVPHKTKKNRQNLLKMNKMSRRLKRSRPKSKLIMKTLSRSKEMTIRSLRKER